MRISYKGEFGKWLYYRLSDNNMSISELAMYIHCDRSTIHRHMNHETKPNRSMLYIYANYFGESYLYLIELVSNDWR